MSLEQSPATPSSTSLREELITIIKAKDASLLDVVDIAAAEREARSQIDAGIARAAALDSAAEGAIFVAMPPVAMTMLTPVDASVEQPPERQSDEPPSDEEPPRPSFGVVALLFHHALLSDWRPAFYAGELLNTLLCDPPDAPGGFTACLVLNLYASVLEAFIGALTGGGMHYLLVNTFVAYLSSWGLFHLLLHTGDRFLATLATFAGGLLLLLSVSNVVDHYDEGQLISACLFAAKSFLLTVMLINAVAHCDAVATGADQYMV